MNCPTCGGEMYDNRQNKKNPKAPDFKCKDTNCVDAKGFVTAVWEKTPTHPVQKNGRNEGQIVRQHSQEMAIRYLTAQRKPFTLEDVYEKTNWFVSDVEGTEMPFKSDGSKSVTEVDEGIDIEEINFE